MRVIRKGLGTNDPHECLHMTAALYPRVLQIHGPHRWSRDLSNHIESITNDQRGGIKKLKDLSCEIIMHIVGCFLGFFLWKFFPCRGFSDARNSLRWDYTMEYGIAIWLQCNLQLSWWLFIDTSKIKKSV